MSWKRHLKIVRPCPILDQVVEEAGDRPLLDCKQCGKEVLNLVYDDADEARNRVLEGAQGTSAKEDLCVIYRVGEDGVPRFAEGRGCEGHHAPALVQAAALGIAGLGTALLVGISTAASSQDSANHESVSGEEAYVTPAVEPSSVGITVDWPLDQMRAGGMRTPKPALSSKPSQRLQQPKNQRKEQGRPRVMAGKMLPPRDPLLEGL